MNLGSERSYSWQNKEILLEHEKWFENLIYLHQISQKWLKTISDDSAVPTYVLKRLSSPDLKKHADILDGITERRLPRSLKPLIYDEHPNEILERLEHTVWIIQSWTLRYFLDEHSASERPALLNTFEQISWKAGRAYLEEKIPLLYYRDNLTELFQALHTTPISGYPKRSKIFPVRTIPNEVEFVLEGPPFHTNYLEIMPIQKELSRIHLQWIRGLAYEFNVDSVVTHEEIDGGMKINIQFESRF